MKQITLAALLFLAACSGNQPAQQTSTDSAKTAESVVPAINAKNIWVDNLNKKKYPLPDSINHKPVSFYLDNPNVAPLAKAFYHGQFRPGNDDSTAQLLSYVTTSDNIVRPFYAWCLDFTILINSGGYGTYTESPALNYALKFPKEFFDFIDEDPSGDRDRRWTEMIAYDELTTYSTKEEEIAKDITTKMNHNCHACSSSIKNRIAKFAEDISNIAKLQD